MIGLIPSAVLMMADKCDTVGNSRAAKTTMRLMMMTEMQLLVGDATTDSLPRSRCQAVRWVPRFRRDIGCCGCC